MKKEIIAGLLLVLLFAGVLVNIRVTERMVTCLTSEAERAYESAVSGDFESAKRQIDAAAEHWLSLDGYTHIFIRHSEINSTTEAFFQLRSDIYAEDAGSAVGSYGLLKETLSSLMTMEQISIGSIF